MGTLACMQSLHRLRPDRLTTINQAFAAPCGAKLQIFEIAQHMAEWSSNLLMAKGAQQ